VRSLPRRFHSAAQCVVLDCCQRGFDLDEQRKSDGTTGQAAPEPRVTSLELFFDLVFVFSITQVTTFWSDHLTWLGLLQGTLILALLWWAWTGYAWLTNAVNLDRGKARVPFFAAMGAMLVASLAVPKAFDHSALLFASAFIVVRAAHLSFFAIGASDRSMRHAVLLLLPGAVIAGGLLSRAGRGGWALGHARECASVARCDLGGARRLDHVREHRFALSGAARAAAARRALTSPNAQPMYLARASGCYAASADVTQRSAASLSARERLLRGER
jgi:hypothetical protein